MNVVETVAGWVIVVSLLGIWVLFVTACVIPWASCDSGTYEQIRYAFCANDLAEAEAGITEETEEFRRLNALVGDAQYGVPFWVVWRIDRRVLRHLDYWARLSAALARRDAEGGDGDAR